jgi:hypothetical protein
MKKAIKRIAKKSNRKLEQMMGGMEVNLTLPIAEVLVATQWHIEQLAGAAGMKIIQRIIEDDAMQLAGEDRYARDGKEGQLWGRQRGWVAFENLAHAAEFFDLPIDKHPRRRRMALLKFAQRFRKDN